MVWAPSLLTSATGLCPSRQTAHLAPWITPAAGLERPPPRERDSAMAQSESDSTSGPMPDSTSGPTSAAATAVNEREDRLAGPGRLISSRWRPRSLRTTPSRQDRGLFGHPRGLPWMLNVEMWERFSYYGMRAILLYFITDTVARGGLGLSETSGQVVIALYGMAVYFLAIPGASSPTASLGPGCPPSTGASSSWPGTSA